MSVLDPRRPEEVSVVESGAFFPGQVFESWRIFKLNTGLIVTNGWWVSDFVVNMTIDSDDEEVEFSGAIGTNSSGDARRFIKATIEVSKNMGGWSSLFETITDAITDGFAKNSMTVSYRHRPFAGNVRYRMTLGLGSGSTSTVNTLPSLAFGDATFVYVDRVYMPESVYVVDSEESYVQQAAFPIPGF